MQSFQFSADNAAGTPWCQGAKLSVAAPYFCPPGGLWRSINACFFLPFYFTTTCTDPRCFFIRPPGGNDRVDRSLAGLIESSHYEESTH